MNEAEETTTKKGWRRYWFHILLVLVFLSSILVRMFVMETYYIPTGSMEPTLHGAASGGDRVLVNKVAYANSAPATGDIIVFKGSEKWSSQSQNEYLIKRVIAVGGQTVGVNDDGQVTVDGKALVEPYIGSNFPFEKGLLDCNTNPRSQRCFPDYKVPEGTVWVMGDNRSKSMDSAWGCRGDSPNVEGCQGPIPLSNITGRAERIVFPLSRGKSL